MASLLKKAKEANNMTNKNQRPRPEIGCKKHQKHKQSEGVCSICLSEKLAQLAKASSSNTMSLRRRGYDYTSNYDSSSSSSSYYSSSCSSCSSPIYCHKYQGSDNYENCTKSNNSGSFITRVNANVDKTEFTKSKSLAFVPRVNVNVQDGSSGKSCEKKSGFWSKLLKPSRNMRSMEKGLVYSLTMRERVAVN